MGGWLEERYDPPDGSTDVGRWQVHLALGLAEKDAVKAAAPQIVPAETFEIHTELDDGGEVDAVFAVRVEAKDADDATGAASWVLTKARRAAGLSTERPVVLGYIAPWWRGPASRHIGKEAVELLKQGRDELAVIRAQTACELLIVETLESLLRMQFPEIEADHLIRRPATLQDRQSKALLQLLVGKRVQDAPWWPSYVEHRKRRNSVVHDGLTITHEDAQASLGVLNDLHAWLNEARQAVFEASELSRADQSEH